MCLSFLALWVLMFPIFTVLAAAEPVTIRGYVSFPHPVPEAPLFAYAT
jgi:hypothetical protein